MHGTQIDALADYRPPDPAADAFTGAAAHTASAWLAYVAGLSDQSQGELGRSDLGLAQAYLDRHVHELGLAFRVTGDDRERPWPLNPMPVLLGADEWAVIEQGLVQRAELLEAVIADIYGPQHLVADAALPAAVLSGSSHFARRMVGMQPPGGKFLQVYAVDLARGPTGEWRVLADRVRLTPGIGYALENRLALSRATGGLLASIGTRRHVRFFETLRRGITASCERSDPRIGLLTPGQFNQSYPEQALLARHLGFSLVEGSDLTVRDGKAFVRTISGLKRIDALWRWINTSDIDPLAFDARSQIGVPNLMAAAQRGLVLANWPGVGVMESRAMPAFLPRLALSILGEPLKLPNAATWWLGGDDERADVLANLDQLVISSAFRRKVAGLPDGHTRAGASLTRAERAELERGIALRPMDYTAQEIVTLSTTPTLVGGSFEPRGFTVRAFLARDENGQWSALQGGFARVSQSPDLRTSLMGLGDISTDLCIVDPAPVDQTIAVTRTQAPAVRREQGLLPSQSADNLFWMGRYGERAHQTARIIRTLVEQVTISGEGVNAASAVTRLANLLRQLNAVPKESRKWQPSRLASEALGGGALGSPERSGSVRAIVGSVRQVGLLLRDRVTRDSWRAMQRPMPRFVPGDLESTSSACDRLVERFAALSRLMTDGLSRGPAWRFLDMGTCIERGSIILQAAQAMAQAKAQRSASGEDLSALLDLVDGQSLYRSRYLTTPFLAPVFDMVLLDPAQPRGLAYQVVKLIDHLDALPTLREDGFPEVPLLLARQLQSRLAGLDAGAINGATLTALRADLGELSNAVGARYFLPNDGPAAKVQPSLLA